MDGELVGCHFSDGQGVENSEELHKCWVMLKKRKIYMVGETGERKE